MSCGSGGRQQDEVHTGRAPGPLRCVRKVEERDGVWRREGREALAPAQDDGQRVI